MNAAELRPDVMIAHRGEKYRVTGEPLLAHRGWSPFDEFAMFFEVPVHRLSDGASQQLRMEVDEVVEVVAVEREGR